MTDHGAILENEKLTRQATLQRKFLEYLALYGLKTRIRLYAGFDETFTAEIESALDGLRQLGYMEIGPIDMVLLTASGREWLKNGN